MPLSTKWHCQLESWQLNLSNSNRPRRPANPLLGLAPSPRDPAATLCPPSDRCETSRSSHRYKFRILFSLFTLIIIKTSLKKSIDILLVTVCAASQACVDKPVHFQALLWLAWGMAASHIVMCVTVTCATCGQGFAYVWPSRARRGPWALVRSRERPRSPARNYARTARGGAVPCSRTTRWVTLQGVNTCMPR